MLFEGTSVPILIPSDNEDLIPHKPAPKTITKVMTEYMDQLKKGTFDPKGFCADIQTVSPLEVDYRKCVQDLFKAAKIKVTGTKNYKMINDLEKMIEALLETFTVKKFGLCEVFFFPSKDNETKIIEYIKAARNSINICMFTITNQNLCMALLESHLRGIKIRLITDDDELKMLGSNARNLSEEGIEVRTDGAAWSLMHNKFVIIDEKILMTGSYNWTARATKANQENVVVMDNAYLLTAFIEEFEKLWNQFSLNGLLAIEGKGKKKTPLYEKYQTNLLKVEKKKIRIIKGQSGLEKFEKSNLNPQSKKIKKIVKAAPKTIRRKSSMAGKTTQEESMVKYFLDYIQLLYLVQKNCLKIEYGVHLFDLSSGFYEAFLENRSYGSREWIISLIHKMKGIY